MVDCAIRTAMGHSPDILRHPKKILNDIGVMDMHVQNDTA